MAIKSIADVVKETQDYIDKRRKGIIKSYKTGYPKFDGANLDGWEWGSAITIGARPSVGKCLGYGTKVVMYDGSLKEVQDIKVGDKLMGIDSTPRTVLSTVTGEENMYTVSQIYGKEYRVNESHILSLKRSRNQNSKKHGEIIDIELKDYLKKSKKFKNNFKGFKEEVEFSEKNLELDPYFLGLWLGDGTSRNTQITNTDFEIENYLNFLSKEINVTLNKYTPKKRCQSFSFVGGARGSKKVNPVLKFLKKLNLLQNKHIPFDYLTSSKKQRLSLLAGIIDSDGSLNHVNGYEITLKSHKLVNDVKYICDSLGFRTSLKERIIKGKVYYRLLLNGNTWDIPVLIERKKAKKIKKRDWKVNAITVKFDKFDKYYGFTIDGDRHFFLEDFTVTHNTVFTSCLLRNSLNCNDFSDIIILEFNWEMSSRVLLLRELSADTKTSYKDVISAGNIKVTDEAFKYYNSILDKYKNMPIYYEEEPKTAKEFAATVRKFRDKYKDKKIIVRVDHTILGRKSAAESGQTEMLYNLFFEGNILKKESDIIFVWLTQLQREFETRQENGTDKAFPRQSDVFGADAAAMYSESIILLNKPSRYGISFYGNRDNGISVEQDDLFAHMVKNRNGEGDVILRYKTHFETMDIREC